MPRFVCGEIIVYSHSFKSISNLCCASRYCANIACIDPTETICTRCLNENSEYFLSSCDNLSNKLLNKNQTIHTLIFFLLNLKIKNNSLIELNLKNSPRVIENTRFCKRRRNNYKRKFITAYSFITLRFLTINQEG